MNLGNFFSDKFMPHGHCFFWRPDILWLSVFSDALIFISYCSIPFTLFYLISKRKDLQFDWIFILFGSFILSCGTTHLVDIITIWKPYYGMAASIKLFTGIVSFSTAIALMRLIPKILAIPSQAQLQDTNEELRRQIDERDRMAHIIETTTDLVGFTDAEGHNIYMNPAGKQMLGLKNTQEVSGHFTDFYPAEAARNYLEKSIPAVLNQGLWQGETVFKAVDGATVPVSQLLMAHRNDLNEVEYLFTIARDISIQKANEDAMRKKNEELEKIYGELDRFVYSASHELRAPVASILGLLNLVEGETDVTEQQQYISLIRTSIYKMDGVIRNLIHYSDNRLHEEQIEEIDFQQLLDKAIQNARRLHAFDHVNLYHTVKCSGPFYSDAKAVYAILKNLIENAITFARLDAQPWLNIEIAVTGKEATITVSDNGEGIDPQFHQDVFKMFFKGSLHTSGSGLGLYIVKEIVDRFHGHIQLHSTPNAGSSFVVTLPSVIEAGI